MNTPMGFIGAMFEPCESIGQALLTSFFMLVLAAGATAIGYAMYRFGELTRISMIPSNAEDVPAGMAPLTSEALLGYGVAGILGMFAILMIVCAFIAPIRTLFPREFGKREDVLR